MIDWGLARTVALTAAGGDGLRELPPVDLVGVADDALPRIRARARLEDGDVPPFEWVGRAAWVDANLAAMEAVLGPVLEAAPPPPAAVRAAAGVVLGAEVGALLGLLGRRVLGQYDLRLDAADLTPPRLLLVGPNLLEAADGLEVDRAALVRWVAVHELTHAVQFGGAPWLRGWLAERVSSLVSTVELKPDPRALLRLDVLGLVERVREHGPAGLLLGTTRGAALDELQAAMSLVEGHAEWVMDTVGEELLGDVGPLRDALEERRDARPVLLRVLDSLLGFDLKLRQYRQGRAFCDAVVEQAGEAALATAWSGPEALPRPAELADAGAWLARTA
ncbi:zinc-dependent metalloprotease [Conexibacter sp. SYSU D00693]|uniref:zinc-dependent metalloprotease n=1 Tax=Conexibacter sp. SYSU D00693 TaxID=2812560 RepID=UPI00196B2008|nr:zinc-dependent metalloprotease [Conexibacter sp. SYSU D00693]